MFACARAMSRRQETARVSSAFSAASTAPTRVGRGQASAAAALPLLFRSWSRCSFMFWIASQPPLCRRQCVALLLAASAGLQVSQHTHTHGGTQYGCHCQATDRLRGAQRRCLVCRPIVVRPVVARVSACSRRHHEAAPTLSAAFNCGRMRERGGVGVRG